MSDRRGVTLLELIATLLLVAVALAIVLPSPRAARDRVAVGSAARELALLLAQARETAVARGAAAVHLDTAAARARLSAPGAPPVDAPLGALYGVRLAATRDSLAFDARGLGRGAANLRVVLSRGDARDTITVSRLGRVR
jgi:prepilin-type N-terminal cleavage/methylation domain-containing protein